MYILLFLLFFFFLILVIFGSILTGIIRWLTGFGRKSAHSNTQSQYTGQSNARKTTRSTGGSSKYSSYENVGNRHKYHTPHQKIFGPDDGEYVNFEEIKE